jgi:hypothetical protein
VAQPCLPVEEGLMNDKNNGLQRLLAHSGIFRPVKIGNELEEYALCAKIIGGLVVVVGLKFVGLKLRQNTIRAYIDAAVENGPSTEPDIFRTGGYQAD